MIRLRRIALSILVALLAVAGIGLSPASAAGPQSVRPALAPVGGPVSTVLVWGDSMTLVWPGYLGELLGIDVVNMGEGGETVQATQARFDAWIAANPGRTDVGHVLWAGHVNANRQNNNPETILPVLQAMAAKVPGDRFMAIGLTNGPDEGKGTPGYKRIVQGVNVDMSRAFGRYYAEVRRFLVTDGLRVAGLTPTAEDQTNINADVPPASLRTARTGNPAHLNDTGRHVTASRMNDLIRGVGWVLADTRAATSTSLISSLNPSAAGQPVRFQARVTNTSGTPGAPSGTVTFQVNRKLLGKPVALKNGVATGPLIGNLPPGSNAVTAYYNGDPVFASSNGSLTQIVNP